MRILFIHNRYRQPGGEDTAVDLEMQLLQQRGHEVQLLRFDNETKAGILAAVEAAIQTVYNKSSADAVKEAILSFQPQVIHVHNFFFKASPSVFYAAHQMSIPVVMTLHNYRLICCNGLLLRAGKPCELCTRQAFPFSGIRYRCYRQSVTGSAVVTAMAGIHKKAGTWKNRINRFIVLNEFAKNKLLHSSLQLPESAFLVKPNFVHDTGTGASNRESFYLFAGRMAKEKGVTVVARAFAELKHIRLIIAGTGPDEEALKTEYRQYPNINFIGTQSRAAIIELMKKSRALVFPSVWYEGLPFVILEAFSTGTPVLASAIGSMAEMIRDGYNGWLFAAGDTEDLKKKVLLFESDPTGSATLYTNARQSWLDRYQPDIHYNIIIKLYEDLAVGNRKKI